MTQDIDIVIDNETTSSCLDAFLASLPESDFIFDEISIRKAVTDRGRFQLLDGVESPKLVWVDKGCFKSRRALADQLGLSELLAQVLSEPEEIS